MKSTFNSIVVAAVIAAAFLGYAHFNMPQQATASAVATPPPAIALKIYGPTEVLMGREFYFHVDTQGKTGVPKWRLVPDVPNALVIFPDGKRARFQCSQPGKFAIMVAVAGDGMDVSSDVMEVDNLNVVEQPDEPQHEEAVEVPAAPQSATVADLVREAYYQAGSPAKAHIVAGSIRSLVGRIETGLLPPDANPVEELRTQLGVAIGNDARPWDSVVDSLGAILDALRRQGNVTTIGSTVPTLQEAAAVLGMQE